MDDCQDAKLVLTIRSLVFVAVSLIVIVPAPAAAQVRFNVMRRQVVEARLKSYKGNDAQREITLKGFFQEAGCNGDTLQEQPVKGLKEPNIICKLPGTMDSVILVGAHFDHVDRGDGVVDNWSGASMLPSLYQGLKDETREHTFIFIAFAGEEKGLVGSRFYVKSLGAEELTKIKAMICMDTLALGPTEVWVSRSNPELVLAANRIAQSLKSPLTGVNVEKVGESDEEAFIQRKIPTITIHSLTQETLSVLHSPKDNYRAVHFDDYYQSYRLLSAYLAYLDKNEVLNSQPVGTRRHTLDGR